MFKFPFFFFFFFIFFFSQCYSCHPCFLLYYSISEWCQVLYMVWTYVCKEEMWESVQEDALFLLWNILSLLISKQELCSFLFCCGWILVFNPPEKDAKVWARGKKRGWIQGLKHGNFTVNIRTAALPYSHERAAWSLMLRFTETWKQHIKRCNM